MLLKTSEFVYASTLYAIVFLSLYFQITTTPPHRNFGEVRDWVLSVTIDNMSLVTAGYGQPTHRAEYDINFDAAVDQTLSALHFFLKKDTANTLDRTRIPARIYRPKRRCIRLRGPNRYDARGLPLLRVGLTARA